MKAVHFGAGNIGRGFVGPLLIESGYELTFIDVDDERVNLLNSLNQYPVVVIGEYEKIQHIRGYKSISARNIEAVSKAVAEADIITTAVGKVALEKVAPSIALGFTRKLELSASAIKPLHVVVVACENVNDNTAYLASLIKMYLSEEQWEEIQKLTSFPNCVIDRIVPNVSYDPSVHPLTVIVEEYNQFVLDRNAFRGAIPDLQNVELADNIAGVLAQKLFTLNMAHSIVGYYGYLAGFDLVHEAIWDERISELLEGALAEVSQLLIAKYGINEGAQKEYVKKMFFRFRNAKLPDKITRITKDPKRKLGPSDRLIAPSKQALEQGIIPTFLSTGITGALVFDYAGDRQALELVSELRQKGIDVVLQDVASLRPDEPLAQMIKSDFLFQELVKGRR